MRLKPSVKIALYILYSPPVAIVGYFMITSYGCLKEGNEGVRDLESRRGGGGWEEILITWPRKCE